MSVRLYCFLVLVLGVATVTLGCVIEETAVVIVGGGLFGHGFVKGAMSS